MIGFSASQSSLINLLYEIMKNHLHEMDTPNRASSILSMIETEDDVKDLLEFYPGPYETGSFMQLLELKCNEMTSKESSDIWANYLRNSSVYGIVEESLKPEVDVDYLAGSNTDIFEDGDGNSIVVGL